MLDIERRHHVDTLLQNLKDIFIALFMLAARNICVCQFVNQHDLRLPREDRVHVQFFKEGPLYSTFRVGIASSCLASSMTRGR